MTRQHEAILGCLSEENRPLSIEEILSLSAKVIPSINLSTIYRNLKNLIEDGEVLIVEIPGEKPRYETSRKEHHHHFICDQCDKVFHIEGCPKGLSDILPEGFSLAGHSITLNGLCVSCQ